VEFPGVGQLLRNRAGRIDFEFDRQLVQALELGLPPVRCGCGLVLVDRFEFAWGGGGSDGWEVYNWC